MTEQIDWLTEMTENYKTAHTKSIKLTSSEADVIRLLREHGKLSRSELAKILGYSRASMTTFVSNLIEQGILMQVGEGVSKGGRRPLTLDINGDFGYVVGYDIGATSMDIAISNFRGDILAYRGAPANVRDGATVLLGHCAKIAQVLLAELNANVEQVVSVGVGVPGPVEFARGILIAPPLMPTWENFEIKKFVNQTFPQATVVVDNDVNVMALGEQKTGAGKDAGNFIFVKIGTGIGSGIIVDGKIYRGANGVAGNIGHISVDAHGPICHCGNHGCIEAIAAGPAIAARAQQAASNGSSDILAQRLDEKPEGLTSIDVAEAAAVGDLISIGLIRQSGEKIGSVLAGLVEFFNPELILIGGGVSNIGFDFLSSIRQAVLQRANPLSTRDLRIEYSSLGELAGVTGAIWLTFDYVFGVKVRSKAKL